MAIKESNKRHVGWEYYPMGTCSSITGADANQIIEEILSVLCKRKLTVLVAKQLLEDTISSIDKEAVLNEML